jgi:hypothetical protein
LLVEDYASSRFLYDEVIGWIDGALMSGQAGRHAGAGFVAARTAVMADAVQRGKPLAPVLAGAAVARQCMERLGLPIDCLSAEDSERRREFCGAVHPFLLPYSAAELRELRAIMRINLRHLDGLEAELAQPVATLRIGYRDAHGQPHFFRNAQERTAWEAQQKHEEQMRQMQQQQQQQQMLQEERRRQLAQQQQNELREQRAFVQLEQERARQQREQQMQAEQQAELERWQAQGQGQMPLSPSQRRSSMWIEDTPPDAVAAAASASMMDNESKPTNRLLSPPPSRPRSHLRDFVELSPSPPSSSNSSGRSQQKGRQLDVSVNLRRPAAATAQQGRARSSAPACSSKPKPKAQGSRAKSARAQSRIRVRELKEGLRMAEGMDEPPATNASDERLSHTPELLDEEAQWQPLPPVTSLLAPDSPEPSPSPASPSPLPPLPSAPRQLIIDSAEDDEDAPTLSRRGQKRQRRVAVSDDESSSSEESNSSGGSQEEDDDDDGEEVMPVHPLSSKAAHGKFESMSDELMPQQPSSASVKMSRRPSGATAKADRPLVKVASSSRPARKLQRTSRRGGGSGTSSGNDSDEDPDEPMMAAPVAVSVTRTHPKSTSQSVLGKQRAASSPMKLRAQIKQQSMSVAATATGAAPATPPFTPATAAALTPSASAADGSSTPSTPGLELTRRAVTDAKGVTVRWEWVYVARSWARGMSGGRLESKDQTLDAKAAGAAAEGGNSAVAQAVKKTLKRPLIANLRRVEEHDADDEMKDDASAVAVAGSVPPLPSARPSVPSLVSPSLDDTPTTKAASPMS